jgi:hypothetical protein
MVSSADLEKGTVNGLFKLLYPDHNMEVPEEDRMGCAVSDGMPAVWSTYSVDALGKWPG